MMTKQSASRYVVGYGMAHGFFMINIVGGSDQSCADRVSVLHCGTRAESIHRSGFTDVPQPHTVWRNVRDYDDDDLITMLVLSEHADHNVAHTVLGLLIEKVT